MSTNFNDGGPAFPSEQSVTPDNTWNQTIERGMSLRDWFAGQALSGLKLLHGEPYAADAARQAWKLANEMIKTRKDNMNPKLFFLDQDNSCHWYLVKAENRAEWEKWLSLPDNDPKSWKTPEFATSIDNLGSQQTPIPLG